MLWRLTDRPSKLTLTLYGANVSAGFPSPAGDHVEGKLDLNEHLIRRPAATYFVRAEGESMRDAGIFSGDLMIVDRSVNPKSGDVVIALVHGDLTVKRLTGSQRGWKLTAANPSFVDISLTELGCEIWGIVTHSIRQHCDR
jgi:DNA polymerase V